MTADISLFDKLFASKRTTWINSINTTLQFHWSLSFPGMSLRIQVCVTRPFFSWEGRVWAKTNKVSWLLRWLSIPIAWLSCDYHMSVMWLTLLSSISIYIKKVWLWHLRLSQECITRNLFIVFSLLLGVFWYFPSFVSEVSVLEGFHCATKIVVRSGSPLARWSVCLDRCFPGLYLEVCVVMKAANVYIKAQG